MKYDAYGRRLPPVKPKLPDQFELMKYAADNPEMLRRTLQHRLRSGEITQEEFDSLSNIVQNTVAGDAKDIEGLQGVLGKVELPKTEPVSLATIRFEASVPFVDEVKIAVIQQAIASVFEIPEKQVKATYDKQVYSSELARFLAEYGDERGLSKYQAINLICKQIGVSRKSFERWLYVTGIPTERQTESVRKLRTIMDAKEP